MHEYSIVQALVAKVEAECAARGASKVHRLNLRIGELSGVETDLLTTAWETFREASICKGATLHVSNVSAIWECPRCHELIPRGTRLQCQACREPARLLEGDEIILDQIEMEVA